MPKLIAAVDTETTGVKPEKGDRIIEVSFGLYVWHDDGRIEHRKTITQRINPLRAIPIEAQRVHGIALEDLKEMPIWVDFADQVKKILDHADVIIGHNVAFDWDFLKHEQRAAGRAVKEIPTFCTMDNARWATFDGKRPSLGELCWALGIEYDTSKAHGAEYDISVTMECFKKGLELGLFKAP